MQSLTDALSIWSIFINDSWVVEINVFFIYPLDGAYYVCLKVFYTFKNIGLCLSSGCYNKNTVDWVTYKQQKFISHSSGGWKSKIKAGRFDVW